MTTGETASLLGVSRQHVVDLCERGELEFVRAGTHRRIRRAEVQRRLSPELTREQQKSLWLHRALLGPLMRDPQGVLRVARENIDAWSSGHRADGMTARRLEQWRDVLEQGVETTSDVLTGRDPLSCELRQNSPFAGVLDDSVRREVLRAFREYWDEVHASREASR